MCWSSSCSGAVEGTASPALWLGGNTCSQRTAGKGKPSGFAAVRGAAQSSSLWLGSAGGRNLPCQVDLPTSVSSTACLPDVALITCTGCGSAPGTASPTTHALRVLGNRACHSQSLKATERQGVTLSAGIAELCFAAPAPSAFCTSVCGQQRHAQQEPRGGAG